MKKWTCLVLLAGFSTLLAQDSGFAPRSSALFLHRYEAREGDPLVECPGQWESPYSTPVQQAFEPGIIEISVGMNRFWRLSPALLAELDHQRGWTLEVRLRILQQTGKQGAIALAVDDEAGQAGVLSGLQIYSNATRFCLDGEFADSTANDDGFHTFRIAEGPDSRTVHAWRDGRYLGSASYPYYMLNLAHFLLVGSWSGRIAGVAEIDYIRWEPSGPFAPAPSLLHIAESDSTTRVSERGPGSDSILLSLHQAPAAEVVMTLEPGIGRSRAEDLDLGSGPGGALTFSFSPENWNIPRTVTITAVDDTLKEWYHTAIIRCRAASSDSLYDGLEEMVTVFLTDNDEVVRLSESGETTEVREEGSTTDSYALHFGLLPDQPVDIALHFDPQRLRINASAITPQHITIQPAQAAAPITIRVAAYDNNDRDLLKHSTIRHLLSSADPDFNRYSPPDLSVRIHENDTDHIQPDSFTIPLINLDQPDRQVVIDQQPGQYLGHPTTVLLRDSTTMLAVYPKGHGSGAIVYKRSFDGGITWSRALPTPASWASSKEVPTIFRMTDPQGVERLILFSGLYPARRAYSLDNGLTWSELEQVGDWGGIVVMGGVIRLKDGRYLALFHDDGRFFAGSGKASDTFTVYKTYSADGGLTWSYPAAIIECDWADPCEPGIFRSPDGGQLLVLLRENSRKFNSFYITSNDEGEHWSPMTELPAALTGDRHTGQYTKDGRLFISFRDMAKGSPTWGDWVGWLGTYDDIIQGREGQYRILFKDNTYSADTAYPGVECLPSGMLVVTTYGHWIEGEQPYIVSTRFKPEELAQNFSPLPLRPCKIVAMGSTMTAPTGAAGEILMAYPDYLSRDLPTAGISAVVLNKGAAGNTTDDALLRFQRDVLDENPDLVIIQFGGEDAMVDLWKSPPVLTPRVPLARYRSNVNFMVQQLKARGIRTLLMTSHPFCWSDTALALYGQPVSGSPYVPADPFGLNTVHSSYVEVMREIAISESVQLVDMYGRLISYANKEGQELSDLAPDGLHLNDVGQRMAASAIYEVLGVTVIEQPDGVKTEEGIQGDAAGGDRPLQFGLQGNYPNPFNPVTELVFALPEPVDIRLEVFDSQGRLVKKLTEGYFQRGRHRLTWDARDAQALPVAAGIYWVRLCAGAVVDAQKMVVLR